MSNIKDKVKSIFSYRQLPTSTNNNINHTSSSNNSIDSSAPSQPLSPTGQPQLQSQSAPQKLDSQQLVEVANMTITDSTSQNNNMETLISTSPSVLSPISQNNNTAEIKVNSASSSTGGHSASVWTGFFGITRRASRPEEPAQSSNPVSPNNDVGSETVSTSNHRHRRSSSSPHRFSFPGTSSSNNNNNNGNNNRQVAIQQSSHRSDDPDVARFERPPNTLSNNSSTPASATDNHSPTTLTASNYRFPTDAPVKIRLVPYNPYFPTVDKELSDGQSINVGRYQRHHSHEDPNSEGIYFRSTVISRKHAILSFKNGEFFIRDVKSLGGTYINSTRISPAGKESVPCKIFHGDVIQFGVDYRPDQQTGQVRNKDKCVEVMVEFPQIMKKKRRQKLQKWDPAKLSQTECCICISALCQKQALFIAPCAHTFHYRCIAPLLRGKGFSCPMCRTESDLLDSVWSLEEESGEDDDDDLEEEHDPQTHNDHSETSSEENREDIGLTETITQAVSPIDPTSHDSTRLPLTISAPESIPPPLGEENRSQSNLNEEPASSSEEDIAITRGPVAGLSRTFPLARVVTPYEGPSDDPENTQ